MEIEIGLLVAIWGLIDQVIAHEMVHVLQHQNTYSNDPSVNGSSRATLLSKGSAEFIHGSDDIGEVLNAVGTGNGDWTADDHVSAVYLADKFLDSEIKKSKLHSCMYNKFHCK